MARKRKTKTSKKLFTTIIAILIPLISGYFAKDELIPPTYELPEGNMAVHFIDVGQGDSTLFMVEEGVVLVDASVYQAGPTIVEYLKKQGVTKIDYFFLTHPDGDHIGGARDVLDAFEVENIIMPDKSHDTRTYENLLLRIEELDINVIKGETGSVYNVGDLEITILSPVAGHNYGRSDKDNNDWSVVFLARFGNSKVMMTGDATAETEEIMLKNHSTAEMKADILKVGHHGSHSSTTDEFLAAVDPDYAVISCGKDNDYGHPHTEVTDRLQKAGITIRITKDEGTIVYMTDGSQWITGQ